MKQTSVYVLLILNSILSNLYSMDHLNKLKYVIKYDDIFGCMGKQDDEIEALQAFKVFLAEPGAVNKNDRANEGWTPLHEACRLNERAKCKMLLEAHSNVRAFGRRWFAPSDDPRSTPLYVAAKYGNTKISQLLLEYGAPIDLGTQNGLSPLSIAVIEGQEAICKLLLENGADIKTNAVKNSLLILACRRGSIAISNLLLIQKANVNGVENNMTPLYVATKNGHLELCLFLIEKGANVNGVTNIVPLWIAAEKGNIKLCQLLIEKGAVVNSTTEFSNQEDWWAYKKMITYNVTPLHIACCKNHVELCKFLLESGADLNAIITNVTDIIVREDTPNSRLPLFPGATCLHLAAGKSSPLICDLLIEKRANLFVRDSYGKLATARAKDFPDKSCYQRILKAQRDEVIRSAKKILFGSSNNDKVKGCNYPLHTAIITKDIPLCELLIIQEKDLCELVRKKDPELYKLLLDGGGNINEQNAEGITPMMLCCETGQIEILDLLLQRKDLIKELKDTKREGTALHWACAFNNVPFCERLLKHGFSPNERARTLSLLHCAVENNNMNLVKLFLEKQKNPNAQDKDGNTPLHTACTKGLKKVVEFFLLMHDKKKIDLNIQTDFGKTALHCAVENSQEEIVELLLRYGASANLADSYQKTPLMYAAEKKNVQMCTYLKKKISTVEFNSMRKFLTTIVKGHRDLEEVFGDSYGVLPVLPKYDTAPTKLLYDSVPVITSPEVQATMTAQSLDEIRISSTSTFETEDSRQVLPQIEPDDQVSEKGTSES